MGRCLNTLLKPSWLALARAKGLLDQEERPRGGEFVEKKSLSSFILSSSSSCPRRENRVKVSVAFSVTDQTSLSRSLQGIVAF
ncbi:hypothetical protein Taro_044559 [Colocasia esculenta]|uniref:Uncharacterized protein n=1 Tax=Colocasia esculenta TaxID=4460 RepID=A0A843X5L0_COLES|nr:hypothetical protein [Colocasia esculenta]